MPPSNRLPFHARNGLLLPPSYGLPDGRREPHALRRCQLMKKTIVSFVNPFAAIADLTVATASSSAAIIARCSRRSRSIVAGKRSRYF